MKTTFNLVTTWNDAAFLPRSGINHLTELPKHQSQEPGTNIFGFIMIFFHHPIYNAFVYLWVKTTNEKYSCCS